MARQRDKLWGTLVVAGDKSCFGGCGVAFSFELATCQENRSTILPAAFRVKPVRQADRAGWPIVRHHDVWRQDELPVRNGLRHRLRAGPADPDRGRAAPVQSVRRRTNPTFGLTLASGLLYGTSLYGPDEASGRAGCGTIHTIDPACAEALVYRFAGGADGSNPSSRLLHHGHYVYRTSNFGGTVSCSGGRGLEGGYGTLLRFDLLSGAGSFQAAGPTRLNGVFHGVTSDFLVGHGTIFALRP